MSDPRAELDLAVENLQLKSPFRISGFTFTDVPVVVASLRRHVFCLVFNLA